MTSWGTRFGVLGRASKDSWNKWWNDDRNATAARRYIEQKFRLRLGPVGYKRFRRLMPSGDLLAPLCQFVRMYAHAEFDFDVEVVLKRDEVPDCRLGEGGIDPSLLGWNTWISSNPFLQDVSDGVFAHEGWPLCIK